MQYWRVRLELLGPFATPMISGTLFGHLCWAMVRRDGDVLWICPSVDEPAPAQALDGDQYMPRVQGPRFGASERMVVSPGHEELGYFHMPGGQSGHPLSPYYGAGHADWAEGKPSPFLPGAADAGLGEGAAASEQVRSNPERQEIRVVVGATRAGDSYGVARIRSHPDELLSSTDLVPGLAAALARTLD